LIITNDIFELWARIVSQAHPSATGWTVWRSNPGGGKIFHLRP